MRVNSLQNQESTKMEPSPPSSFSFQEVHYELHSTESVRRNATAGSSDNVKGVMTETVLDLETSQKASVCLVIFLSANFPARNLQYLGTWWESRGG